MTAWSGVGEAYAASYAELCAGTTDAIVTELGPAESRSVLDVGSGTGLLAAVLADSGWLVTACEPEQTMREVSQSQHPAVTVVDGDLPELPFSDDSFDAVTANFVLNHVGDPRVAAAEMTRIATPGGLLVSTIWTLSPSWFWREVGERTGLAPTTVERLPADKDFERSVEGFGRMLREGQWRAVDVSELAWTWHAPRDALWASVAGGVASAGAFYLSLDNGGRSSFRSAFDALCEERAVDGRIALEHSAAVAVGRAS